MADTGRPTPPDGLGDAGLALWAAVMGAVDENWDLDGRDLDCLARACSCADRIALLEEEIERDGVTVAGSKGQKVLHPCIAEIRQCEIARLRLLSAIELADPKSGARNATPAQARARHAANVRWDLEEQRTLRRGARHG